MYAVVLSGNIITFLISWETMSLVSYFLVTLQRDEESALPLLILSGSGIGFLARLLPSCYLLRI